jgi:hypothetical protein
MYPIRVRKLSQLEIEKRSDSDLVYFPGETLQIIIDLQHQYITVNKNVIQVRERVEKNRIVARYRRLMKNGQPTWTTVSEMKLVWTNDEELCAPLNMLTAITRLASICQTMSGVSAEQIDHANQSNAVFYRHVITATKYSKMATAGVFAGWLEPDHQRKYAKFQTPAIIEELFREFGQAYLSFYGVWENEMVKAKRFAKQSDDWSDQQAFIDEYFEKFEVYLTALEDFLSTWLRKFPIALMAAYAHCDQLE